MKQGHRELLSILTSAFLASSAFALDMVVDSRRSNQGINSLQSVVQILVESEAEDEVSIGVMPKPAFLDAYADVPRAYLTIEDSELNETVRVRVHVEKPKKDPAQYRIVIDHLSSQMIAAAYITLDFEDASGENTLLHFGLAAELARVDR